MKLRNLTGRRFGKLVVTDKFQSRGVNPRKRIYWFVQCDCGKSKWINAGSLVYGRSQSCGCKSREVTIQGNYKHGMSGTLEHRRWAQMLGRCNNVFNRAYPDYGGRGIVVCDQWDPEKGGSFENFFAWSGRIPFRMTIDRIDNDGPYSPENCRLATYTQQMRNTRRTCFIEFQGHSQPLMAWAQQYAIDSSRLRARLRAGWAIERALTEK